MGEYVTITVYKPMNSLSFLPSKFEKLCWDLYHANNDRNKIEEIYRGINFVQPNGNIFDLNMRFLEKDGTTYQTNSGVYGSEQLPNLSLSYKFYLHDFWLSILEPRELMMNDHNTIECRLDGRTIHHRFTNMLRANSSTFQNSAIWRHFKEGESGYPPLEQLIGKDDLVEIHIGHIYYAEDGEYRSAARKNITEQRKEIASECVIPHWTKKTPK